MKDHSRRDFAARKDCRRFNVSGFDLEWLGLLDDERAFLPDRKRPVLGDMNFRIFYAHTDFGRRVTPDGPEAETHEILTQSPDQTRRMHEQDIEFAWKGLLILRMRECSDLEDDVLLLLRVLAENPEIEASFTTQWPIKAIVIS